MGKVKLADLHRLLDLVDEAGAKSNLRFCIDFTKTGINDKSTDYIITLAAYKEIEGSEGVESGLEQEFRHMFYVGGELEIYPGYEADKVYLKCRDYLLGIIGDDSDV